VYLASENTKSQKKLRPEKKIRGLLWKKNPKVASQEIE
jgi:hypothetical protein